MELEINCRRWDFRDRMRMELADLIYPVTPGRGHFSPEKGKAFTRGPFGCQTEFPLDNMLHVSSLPILSSFTSFFPPLSQASCPPHQLRQPDHPR